MKKVRLLAVGNTVALVLQIIYAYLSQQKIGNGASVKEISDQHPSLFTPASFTFSIWGPIYTGLLLFSFAHLISAYSRKPNHGFNIETGKTGGWFIASNFFALAWFYAFTHNLMLIALLFIGLQLAGLIIINIRLRIFDREAGTLSRIFTQIPFAIYLAWLSVASIAQISLVLAESGLDLFSLNDNNWTVVLIAFTTILALVMIIYRRNIWFGLVVAWALFGILSACHSDDPLAYHSIIRIAWLGIAFIGIVCILKLIQIWNKVRSNRSRLVAQNHQNKQGY